MAGVRAVGAAPAAPKQLLLDRFATAFVRRPCLVALTSLLISVGLGALGIVVIGPANLQPDYFSATHPEFPSESRHATAFHLMREEAKPAFAAARAKVKPRPPAPPLPPPVLPPYIPPPALPPPPRPPHSPDQPRRRPRRRRHRPPRQLPPRRRPLLPMAISTCRPLRPPSTLALVISSLATARPSRL